MVYTFYILDLGFLIYQNSEFEILRIYDIDICLLYTSDAADE